MSNRTSWLNAIAAGVKATVQAVRGIANSKGGQELINHFNLGRAESANILFHGHAASIYPQATHEIPKPAQQSVHGKPATPTNQMNAQQAVDRSRLTNLRFNAQEASHNQIQAQHTPTINKSQEIAR